jgi:sugar O-acyltransferase (sialic acid O-acetyltransferase NeuD family)
MNKPGLILIGAGGHARACIDVIEQQGEFSIVGLVGMSAETGATHMGYAVIGADDDLPRLAGRSRNALIVVGHIRSADARIRLHDLALKLGFVLPAIVAPTAYVSNHASIGAGTIVMHGAIVNAGAKVGNNCIINSRALIEHDANVGSHCHVSTGAILNGNATLGAGGFVGSGSVIREGVSIGERCLVGMGVIVRHDQADGARVVGSHRS